MTTYCSICKRELNVEDGAGTEYICNSCFSFSHDVTLDNNDPIEYEYDYQVTTQELERFIKADWRKLDKFL